MISIRSFISTWCGIVAFVLAAVLLTAPIQGRSGASAEAGQNKPSTIQFVFSVVNEHSELLITSDEAIGPYKTFYLTEPNRLVLDIQNAELPEGYLSMPVDREELKDIRIAQHEDKVRFVFDISDKTSVEHSVEQVPNGLKVTLTKKSQGRPQTDNVQEIPPQKPAQTTPPQAVKPQEPPVQQPAATIGTQVVKPQKIPAQQPTNTIHKPIPSAAPPASAALIETPPQQDSSAIVLEKTYTGRKINVRLFKADVKEFFAIISEASGARIEVAPDIHKEITIRLTEVPWDQAVDLVSKFYGLQLDKDSDVWRVVLTKEK